MHANQPHPNSHIITSRRFSLVSDDKDYEKRRDDILRRVISPAPATPPPAVVFDATISNGKGDEMKIDWNGRFQAAVDEVNTLSRNHSPAKRIEAYSKLGKLYQNFIDTATLYGKILISERYLPESCRTFKSANIGGIAGGEKFLVQNILFKICSDPYGVFGGDEHYCHKLASHELKGLINIYNYGSRNGLYVPMMCVLNYKGFTMIAMSVLPISSQTLVYGSSDAGETIHDDTQVNQKLTAVASELGLKRHKVGKGANSKYICTPLDLEGHRGTDGRIYLLDFSRVFPPEQPQPTAPKYMYLCRLLRPEFVKFYSEENCSLSPDAYSRFTLGIESETQDRLEIDAATKFLLESHLPEWLKRFQRFNAIDPFAWLESLHTHGINYRHMGALRRLVIAQPMGPNYTGCDASTLFLMAMIARVVKNQMNTIMRSQVKSHGQSIPGDQMLKQVAAQFLNLVFGVSKAASNFWNTTMKLKLSEYFPKSLTDEEVRDPHFGDALLKSEYVSMLFLHSINLCGLRLRFSAIEQFKVKENFAFAEPIDESDIEEIKERVQSMSVAAFAEGFSMQTKATFSTNENEAKRLYRLSLEKFKKALEMEPANIQALTQIFQNMIATDHPKVAESIYHSVVYGHLFDSEFLWRYANFLVNKGDVDKRAEDHYLLSLDLDPNYANCLCDYAKFLASTQDLYSATRCFMRAEKVAPFSVMMLIDYALFKLQYLQDAESAVELVERAVASPDFHSYLPILKQHNTPFLKEISKHAKKFEELFGFTADLNVSEINQHLNNKPAPPPSTGQDLLYVDDSMNG
eukprot:TRINITY_DN5061_c0_g1_i1.p1 TRINITY_DN5061_c0_g1~~TRINITY_DN5061_c0_g1_i1.p1  ORF type:complete len:804 (-),score=206.00 TRINITY_DN5061_c0_g1_i1:162-2573(-)